MVSDEKSEHGKGSARHETPAPTGHGSTSSVLRRRRGWQPGSRPGGPTTSTQPDHPPRRYPHGSGRRRTHGNVGSTTRFDGDESPKTRRGASTPATTQHRVSRTHRPAVRVWDPDQGDRDIPVVSRGHRPHTAIPHTHQRRLLRDTQSPVSAHAPPPGGACWRQQHPTPLGGPSPLSVVVGPRSHHHKGIVPGQGTCAPAGNHGYVRSGASSC